MSDQQQSTRPKAIPSDRVTWSRPAYAAPESEALVAEVEGFILEIGKGEGKTWDWAAKTETEVVVSGVAKSQRGAQCIAREQLNQYRLKTWQRGKGVAQSQAAGKAKVKPEPKQPSKAQMEKALDFVDRQLKPPAKKTRTRTRKLVAA